MDYGSRITNDVSPVTRHATVRRLLVRGPNWIGDAVMSEPALAALRRLCPQAEITLLVKPAIAELFGHHPAVDRVFVYDDQGRHAGLTGKWTLAGVLRRHRFDLAVLFQNAFEAALLAFLAGVPRRYGYATDGRSFLLTDPIAVPNRQSLHHQVHYYWQLLSALGNSGPVPAPRLYLSKEERDAADRRLSAAGITSGDFIIGVNPGSTYGGAKRWPAERFAQTVNRLVAYCRQAFAVSARVVIVGARGEEELGQAIAGAIEERALVLSGQTTVRELMAVAERCGLFLTNDTGPMHVAAAFNVPVVAIFGPTDWRMTSPFGEGHRLIRQPVDCAPCLLRECPIDHRCMTGVSVEEVYQASVQLLTPHASRVTSHAPLAGVTVFLDRDGTLNTDTGYIATPSGFELLPGVGAALARLKRAGARLVVVTNQSGVSRGKFTLKDLEMIHAKLRTLLEAEGVSLDAVYFCPHHPDDQCLCRKPGTAMIERAAADLGLDLSRAYVVGDQSRDIELARRIEARSILVTTGPGSREAVAALRGSGMEPDTVVPSLSDAVEWIVADVSRSTQLSAVSHQRGVGSMAEKLTADS